MVTGWAGVAGAPTDDVGAATETAGAAAAGAAAAGVSFF